MTFRTGFTIAIFSSVCLLYITIFNKTIEFDFLVGCIYGGLIFAALEWYLESSKNKKEEEDLK